MRIKDYGSLIEVETYLGEVLRLNTCKVSELIAYVANLQQEGHIVVSLQYVRHGRRLDPFTVNNYDNDARDNEEYILCPNVDTTVKILLQNIANPHFEWRHFRYET